MKGIQVSLELIFLSHYCVKHNKHFSKYSSPIEQRCKTTGEYASQTGLCHFM